MPNFFGLLLTFSKKYCIIILNLMAVTKRTRIGKAGNGFPTERRRLVQAVCGFERWSMASEPVCRDDICRWRLGSSVWPREGTGFVRIRFQRAVDAQCVCNLSGTAGEMLSRLKKQQDSVVPVGLIETAFLFLPTQPNIYRENNERIYDQS